MKGDDEYYQHTEDGILLSRLVEIELDTKRCPLFKMVLNCVQITKMDDWMTLCVTDEWSQHKCEQEGENIHRHHTNNFCT